MSTSNSNNSASVKRKRSVNPQGDENFIRALEAVRSGGIGFCKAAKLYGVNNRTLWLEYKKRGYPVSRPSIKSRVVKQEPNLSPSPTPPANTADDTNENYEHMAAAVAAAQSAALNMQIPPTSDTPTPSLMCTPHHASTAATTGTHPTMMSFLDTRHIDFPPSLHSMSRQRYIDATGASGGPGAGTINNSMSTSSHTTTTAVVTTAAIPALTAHLEQQQQQQDATTTIHQVTTEQPPTLLHTNATQQHGIDSPQHPASHTIYVHNYGTSTPIVVHSADHPYITKSFLITIYPIHSPPCVSPDDALWMLDQ
uniref:HTH psq-type domain-containing protein n=1 Tax=Glossina brevipalpis TaxID=37001 RepID=A0A1A9WLT7_9MUSC